MTYTFTRKPTRKYFLSNAKLPDHFEARLHIDVNIKINSNTAFIFLYILHYIKTLVYYYK